MLPAHLADRLLKQRRDAESAEFARQLPLHVDDPRWMTDPDEAPEGSREPDWMSNY
ncbi:hypothetical protein [Azospirillum agricola]|uniref:hypothetical protein n=1 Tax=Azospirillum agricola TaxID=1720247 RepID=UPI000A0F0B64|nr:hypothetical protein [Azospirillum agricola]MBP2232175.1 hypothetical protein [Azospirillum agricola]SMH56965.1 hypothetical protein SAMN02982994_4226 [Azospirillum lipoferum]